MLDRFKNDVMVDIETLDVVPSAVVLSIGATRIDGDAKFYAVLDRKSQYIRDRTVSPDTTVWWERQSAEAREVFQCETRPVFDVLTEFTAWLSENLGSGGRIWCKGTDFDTMILAHLYKRYDRVVPWKYNQPSDWRAVKNLLRDFGVEFLPATPTHNALADAELQAAELRYGVTALLTRLAPSTGGTTL